MGGFSIFGMVLTQHYVRENTYLWERKGRAMAQADAGKKLI